VDEENGWVHAPAPSYSGQGPFPTLSGRPAPHTELHEDTA